jgi:transposase InsO family protein
VELSDGPQLVPEVLVSHRNAPLSELGRLRLARCVVDDGWPLRRAAERFQVSVTTAARWASRYRDLGAAGMADRSSRPHHCPAQTRPRLVKKVVHLRTKRGWGPARIGPKVGLPASTVHKILRREGLPRLSEVDLATRQALRRSVRRYEHDAPGDLVHLDIKKLGQIPDGGGWRIHGRAQGGRNSQAHRDPARPRTVGGRANLGYGYVHTAIDDHSRLAYSEILPNETGPTAAAFWHRANTWFASCGITVTAVLTDNGSCYRSHDFAAALTTTTGTIKHRRTRPYRPQTNGKVERFNRTLLTEWAYARPYPSESARRAALPKWLHIYNHHRHHTAIGGLPPASRVPNLCGQYT